MQFKTRGIVVIASAVHFFPPATLAKPIGLQQELHGCQKTTVAILGAGIAGITAAQALTNQSITDFLIVEYNGEVGGRAKSAQFGVNKENGRPYTIELGANWIEGLGSKDGPENPIWALAKKWELTNHPTNKSKILTYNETGAVDYSEVLDSYQRTYPFLESLSGEILSNNLQDLSVRAGLSLAGWQPGKNMAAQAADWWFWDWESAQSPDGSSLLFGIAETNLTFNYFSDESNFVTDQRGYSTFIKGEASTFLQDLEQDQRLLLNTIVRKLEYSKNGIVVHNADGTCIHAAYAICTFSLGVLQNKVVEFLPPLPGWKSTAIEMFRMGTYTKIFLQFERQFWSSEAEFLLYADPKRRGYYTAWQSLSLEGFHPGSNILFVTVVGEQSYRVEAQSDEETQAEVMQVLRLMFPDIDVPEPIDFFYPRWTLEPWAHGSYSDWPLGTTLEMHQNLRANLGRLWFAGEAMSAQYIGLLQGAWFEGREVGLRIASLITGHCVDGLLEDCGKEVHYDTLHGTTPLEQYNSRNGWPLSSFGSDGSHG